MKRVVLEKGNSLFCGGMEDYYCGRENRKTIVGKVERILVQDRKRESDSSESGENTIEKQK